MRASTRRRITLALVGLLVIALIGWFVQESAAATDADVGSTAQEHVVTPPAGQVWTVTGPHTIDQ